MHALLRRIERHLRFSGTPATTFGRKALRDPALSSTFAGGASPAPPLPGA